MVECLSGETRPVADGHDEFTAVDEVKVVAWVEPVFFDVVDLFLAEVGLVSSCPTLMGV